MKKASKIMKWAAGTLAVVPAALAGFGAPAIATVALVILIVVAALCWTIMDEHRSERLAMLISAWRGNAIPWACGDQPALPVSGPERAGPAG